MQKKILCFRPEYFGKFKCNGEICSAKCCKNWNVEVDDDTYKLYKKIRPKFDSQEIFSHIATVENSKTHFIMHDENNFCPFLTENNFCKLQKKYGENYLSLVCRTYPRRIFDFENFCESSLDLTCPVVAEIIFSSDEPMIFEQVEIPSEFLTKFGGKRHNLTPKLVEKIFEIQFAAISILQERNLTTDQRLVVLGFFLDQLQEFVEHNQFEKISALVETYTAENFLSQNKNIFLSAVKFNSQEFIKILFGEIFPALYTFDKRHQKYLDAVIKTLKINISDEIKINEVAENFLNLSDSRKNFLQTFSAVFENYLVNEFFTNLYPFNLESNIKNNFGVFVATYKILELFTFSIFYDENKNFLAAEKNNLVSTISELVNAIDHLKIYTEKISQIIEDKNIFSIMNTFLQV